MSEDGSNKNSEKTPQDSDKKTKVLDNKEVGKKLIWEVHSDTFIKCPKKTVKTKDGQSNKSKQLSHNKTLRDNKESSDKPLELTISDLACSKREVEKGMINNEPRIQNELSHTNEKDTTIMKPMELIVSCSGPIDLHMMALKTDGNSELEAITERSADEKSVKDIFIN